MLKAAIISMAAIGFAALGVPVHDAPAATPAIKATCFDGAWSSKTTYAPGVVVSYNGANYMSLVKNTNDSPLSSFADWSILDASAAKGPNCTSGSGGPAGPAGSSGSAPSGGNQNTAAGGSTPSGPSGGTAPNGPSEVSGRGGGSQATPSAGSNGSPSPSANRAAARPAKTPSAAGSQSPPYVPGTSTLTGSMGRSAPIVITTVSIYDLPAVPDIEGNGVIIGLLTGKGLHGIEPNLKVCVRKRARPARRQYVQKCASEGTSA